MPPKRRYYFHDDVVEDDARLVYCARCDEAVPVAHFYDMTIHPASRVSDYDRYLRSRKAWDQKSCPLRLHFSRPETARNIFA